MVVGTGDLIQLTQQLVDVESVSFAEGPLVDLIAAELADLPHLKVDRIGDNLVARTDLGRNLRIVLGGHTDTVPVNDNLPARLIDGEVWGCGAADMKGGLAVMLELARRHREPAVDVTWIFYAREEVAADHSGLAELIELRPDLLAGDVAILGEPTTGDVEAGCQGVLRVTLTLAGARAHTARAWMGRNAVHRLGDLLVALSEFTPRQPEICGLRFHEALQATHVSAGVAGNVVPDSAEVRIAHRFAPDRSVEQAEDWLRSFLAPFIEPGDELVVDDRSSAAWPALEHPVVKALVERNGLEVRSKLGWTDVARFTELGVAAINLGPGDSTLAHTREERVSTASLDRTFAALDELLSHGL
ncbi:MAG: succinyl-diaminopimelate desuccinylase [Actinobacteria bacterium]|nr:succinyl-diaminopimelate desuccinylase [Actinomycetota bacterium]